MSNSSEAMQRLVTRLNKVLSDHNAHVYTFREWENEWYGPQGNGPNNLGSGHCLTEDLSMFYEKCADHAYFEGEGNDSYGPLIRASIYLINDDTDHTLPAVNGNFVLQAHH